MHGVAADPRVRVQGLFGVYRGDRRLVVDDVHVLPVETLCADLQAGRVF